ncbi:MAG: hypothetical protein K2M47_07915 [Clostridiales bacterium]|nr:hypothetical protein [Clostridiales bacterium]
MNKAWDFFRDERDRNTAALADAAPDGPTETLFFSDSLTALKAAAPDGSSVCAIGFDNTDFILRAGFRLADGECDVCIARGGAAEFATARRTIHKKLILLPTHDYPAAACTAFRTEVKSFAVLSSGKRPFAVVFDETDAHDNHASLFGEIVALDLAAFDAEFCARMTGRRVSGDNATQIAELVTELTAELKQIDKDVCAQKTALVRAGRRAAQIVAATPELLSSSGAAQAAEAYRMLCAAEQRPSCMRGELEMIFGAYVTDFYIKSLSSMQPNFPPDNNRRIDSITSNLGADVRRACVHVSPIYPPQKLMLHEYRIKEFKGELLRTLTGVARRRSEAWQVFKRLYPDDGYCLKTLVDKTDAPLCVALAPDVLRSDSLLSFLKQAGKLEKYVI